MSLLKKNLICEKHFPLDVIRGNFQLTGPNGVKSLKKGKPILSLTAILCISPKYLSKTPVKRNYMNNCNNKLH